MDTRGRRPVIVAASVVAAGAIALFPTVEAIGPWVYALRGALFLAQATLYTALFTHVADHVPARRRTQGLGLFGASALVSLSIGGALGDAVLAAAGYGALFAAATGFAVAGLVFVLPLRDAVTTGSGDPPPRGFRAALLQTDLVPLWWMSFAFFAALAAHFTFLKTYVMETGTGSVGGFFTAYTATALALRVGLGGLPDRLGPLRVLPVALAALAAGLLVLAGAGDATDVVLAGLLCGAGHGYAFPILYGLVIARARARERGSASALYTALDDGGGMLGGPLFGLLIERAGYPAMFETAAGVIVVGGVSFLVWDRRRARRRTPRGAAGS